MSGSRTPKKSAEQRRAEAKRLHSSIKAQVELLANSHQEWVRFCRAAAKFRKYSFTNLLLIQQQMPGATQVAGYRQWQAAGRQVRRGERALKIFGYRQRVVPAEEGEDEGGEGKTRVVAYFPVLSVFDISQTDPAGGEEEPRPPSIPQREGADDAGVYDAVTRWIQSQGWTVSRETPEHGAYGVTYTSQRRIVIAEDLTPAQAAETALHESAHALMHSDPSTRSLRRQTCEIEAESVAFIAAEILGLDTTGYSIEYIAEWSGYDAKAIEDTAARVLTTTNTIVEALA